MMMARTRGDGPNKMALVRDALTALGPKAKPKAIRDHIMEHAKVEITPTMISSYKSNIQKSGKKRGRKPKDDSMGPGRPGRPSKLDTISVNDIAEVKALLEKHGPRKLSDLIDLFA
jgi:hypothetical protein